jgi:BASS family bile acid:Na+ symporter
MIVLGLATAQRNIAAALVIAASLSGDVVVLTMVGALVIPVVLIGLAGELGKRFGPADDAPAEETEAGATA